MRRERMQKAGAAVLALAMATPAWADTAPVGTDRIFSDERLRRYVHEATPSRAAQDGTSGRRPKRDSLLNGALIGAAIGGVGGSALIVASRGGSDNIPKAMWNVSLAPTIVGAVAGAIVDALR
jgi:hypothetical protein